VLNEVESWRRLFGEKAVAPAIDALRSTDIIVTGAEGLLQWSSKQAKSVMIFPPCLSCDCGRHTKRARRHVYRLSLCRIGSQTFNCQMRLYCDSKAGCLEVSVRERRRDHGPQRQPGLYGFFDGGLNPNDLTLVKYLFSNGAANLTPKLVSRAVAAAAVR